MNLTRIVCAGLLALALVTVVACGDDDTNSSASETPTGTPHPTAPLNLPEDFPEDFPLYPDISLDQSARFENQVLAVFSSDDTRGNVADFYRERLSADPWQLVTENVSGLGDVITITFKNASGDIRGTLTLSEPAAGAGTEINTTFTVPQLASPLPTIVPTEPANETPTPEANGAG